MKLASLALVLVIQSPLIAQTTVTHVDPVQEPSDSRVQVGGIVNHPDGGVVSVFRPVDVTAAPFNRVVFRRLNEAGDRLWTVDRGIPTTALVSFQVDPFMTSRGSTVALLQFGTGTRLVSVDRNGAFEWDRQITSTVSGATFRAHSVGSTSDGDVYIAGGMDSPSLPLFDGRATVRLLDRATGAELWRYETPAVQRVGNTVAAAFGDDDAFLVFKGTNNVTAERVNRNGQLVYSVSDLQPNLVNSFTTAIGSTPGGELTFSQARSLTFNLTTQEAVSLDPAGGIRWQRMLNQAAGTRFASVTAEGELFFLGRVSNRSGASQFMATRFGPSGFLQWQNATVPNWSFHGLSPSTDGGAALIGHVPPVSGSAWIGRLMHLDAATGAVAAIETFESIGNEFGNMTPAVHDPRGNLWLTASRFEGAAIPPRSAITIKLSSDEVSGSPFCAQSALSSTGLAGRLRATGSSAVSRNNVTLVADQLPDQQFVLFLNATALGFVANPGGSLGDLCLGEVFGRYAGPGQVRSKSSLGLASLQLELPRTPSGPGFVPITSGQTWNFQAWHRDLLAGTAASNFTGAIAVTFQ